MLHGGDGEGDACAENGQKQDAAPACGGLGQAGGLKQQRQHQHGRTRHQLLEHAQLQGIHLRLVYRVLHHQEVDAVAQGAQQADEVSRRRAEIISQGQQPKAHRAENQAQQHPPLRPFPVHQKGQKGCGHRRQGADKPGVGDGGIQQAHGGADVGEGKGKTRRDRPQQGLAVCMPQLGKQHNAQQRKGQQKPHGAQGKGRHLPQGQVGQVVGAAPKAGDQHQQQVGFAMVFSITHRCVNFIRASCYSI